MPSKLKRIIRYCLYFLLSNALYGIVLYYSVTNLAQVSLLYGYLANLGFIILGLAIDVYILHSYESPKFIEKAKAEKNRELAYRLISLQLNSFISFKTSLYLFYILVLIVSQVISFNPDFSNTNIENFVRAVDYSVILLLAYDELRGQFSKDKSRISTIFENFKKKWNEVEEPKTE